MAAAILYAESAAKRASAARPLSPASVWRVMKLDAAACSRCASRAARSTSSTPRRCRAGGGVIPDAIFTLAKAKAHLRVPHAEEDALITALLDAAVGAVERLTRRAWTERTWSVAVDGCDLEACSCDSAVFHAELSPATAKVFTFDPAGSGHRDAGRPGEDLDAIRTYGRLGAGLDGRARRRECRTHRLQGDAVAVPADIYAASCSFSATCTRTARRRSSASQSRRIRRPRCCCVRTCSRCICEMPMRNIRAGALRTPVSSENPLSRRTVRELRRSPGRSSRRGRSSSRSPAANGRTASQ